MHHLYLIVNIVGVPQLPAQADSSPAADLLMQVKKKKNISSSPAPMRWQYNPCFPPNLLNIILHLLVHIKSVL